MVKGIKQSTVSRSFRFVSFSHTTGTNTIIARSPQTPAGAAAADPSRSLWREPAHLLVFSRTGRAAGETEPGNASEGVIVIKSARFPPVKVSLGKY